MNEFDKIDALDQMRMGIDYRQPVSIRKFSVLVRPLSISEHTELAAEVTSELERAPEKYKTNITQDTLIAQLTLIRATTSGVGINDPKLTMDTLDRFTPAEIEYLFKEYNRICHRASPTLEEMPPEEVEELIERVKKNQDQLTELSVLQLLNLARHFVINAE